MSTYSDTSDAEFQQEISKLEVKRKNDKIEVLRNCLESLSLPFPLKLPLLNNDNVGRPKTIYIQFTIMFYQVKCSLLDGHATVLTNLLFELSKLKLLTGIRQ